MKKITLSILSLAIALSSQAQGIDRSIRPKAGPAPEIKLGKTESFTLPNGLKVFVVENHKLPTMSVSIQLDVRPELEGSMAGYSDIVGELLTSGTKTRSKDKLNQEIDFIGATVSAGSEEVSAYGLKKHQNKILELLSDVVMNSDFKQEELDKVKTQTLSGLETQKNDPDAMLDNVTKVLNYSVNHPYGEIPTEQTIKNITLERCKKYYETYFRPNVAYMAVVGDITMAEIKPLIIKYFGGWQKAEVPVAMYSQPSAPLSPKVAFVQRDGAVQSVINVTAPIELKPGSSDEFAAKVANTVLGGGSQGRLFLNLREKHGWTYGSYSSLNSDLLVGSFTAYAKCRNAVTDSSVSELLSEMNRLQSEPVDAASLQNTISYMSGGFAIGLESPQRVAQYAINTELYKLPKDYYQNYLKSLSAVTAADVQAAAKKYMGTKNINIIVVGNKDEVAKKLATYAKNGIISYYDNYGNPVKVSETRSAGNKTADEVMKAYVAALGGENAIKSIKDMKTVAKGSTQGAVITVMTWKKHPGKVKLVVNGEFNGNTVNLQRLVLNGDKGYREAQGNKAKLEGKDLAQAKEQADIQYELHPEQYGHKRTIKGIGSVNGADAYIIETDEGNGEKKTEYYDVASGLLVKEISTEEGATSSIEFSDYKDVSGGYKMPHTFKQSGPQGTIEFKVTSVEVNKNIPDTEFN